MRTKMRQLYRNIIPQYFKVKIKVLWFGSNYPDCYDKYKVIFIHIPKVAGSSISLSLFGDETLSHHPYTYADFEFENKTKFDTYFKFAFVRNPWDRLVSAYEYLQNVPHTHRSTQKFAKENIACYGSFEEFVKNLYLKKELRSWLHFIPQTEFICKGSKVKVDFVGKYENLVVEFSKIAELTNFETVKLPHVNRSRTNRDFTNYYNDETKEIVKSIYYRDIELFNYSFEKSN